METNAEEKLIVMKTSQIHESQTWNISLWTLEYFK